MVKSACGCASAVAVIVLSSCAASAGEEPRVPISTKCDVHSLAAVFESPLAYQKRRFCGEAVGYLNGRVLEVFPEGPLPRDRLEMAAFLDRKADLRAKSRVGASGRIKFYVDAVVDLQMPCFKQSSTGDTCIPYTHPIHLRVKAISFP
jgi:hypothetical protein